jgi:tellurite methyltransferase
LNLYSRREETRWTWRAALDGTPSGSPNAGGVSRWLTFRTVGIQKARRNAAHLGDKIEFQVADLKNFNAGRRRYDLLLVFYYLERKLFPQLVRALRPGGLLIYKTYTREQRKFKRGPSHPLHLLKENELLKAFSDLHVLHYCETTHDRAVAEFVGRKA